MNPSTRFIEIKKKKLFNLSIGEGSPIVFIPGWLPMVEDLPFKKILIEKNLKFLKKYKINFLLLSNFYKSSFSEKPYSLEDYAEELKLVIEKENYSKVSLIGHSAGGRHVIYFAHKYPELVDKLILMNAAGLKSPKLKDERLSRAKFFFAKFYANNDEKEKILKPTFANLYTSDLTSILPEIKAKTLIIWGDKDKEMNIKKAYKFNQLIPNSQLKVFENMDHMTINRPEVYEEIFEFLSK